MQNQNLRVLLSRDANIQLEDNLGNCHVLNPVPRLRLAAYAHKPHEPGTHQLYVPKFQHRFPTLQRER